MAKAWDVPGLGPDVALARCARLIVDTRFREMMSYREGTIAGVDIEQLHSMRVSSRRLRSAMRNFRNCFEPAGFKRHIERVREIADTLGAVRDIDVRIAWFEGVLASARRDEKPGIRLLVANARAEREGVRLPMLELLARLEREQYAHDFLDFVWGKEGAARG
jgi:CHAD domain-containing protein